jgi:hypothetical protein
MLPGAVLIMSIEGAIEGGDVRAHRYRITVSGGLGETGRYAFGDFTIESNGVTTALIANLDQAALHGALNRIQSFGLELVELTRLADDAG